MSETAEDLSLHEIGTYTKMLELLDHLQCEHGFGHEAAQNIAGPILVTEAILAVGAAICATLETSNQQQGGA